MAVKRTRSGTVINRQVSESKPAVGFEGNMTSFRLRVVNVGGKRTEQVPVIDIPDLPGAVCKGIVEPDLWGADAREKAKRAEAVRLCGVCPVRQKCLDYALAWDRDHPKFDERLTGIWGGLTDAERRTILEQEKSAVA